jgi:hypothetical protein
MHFVVNGYTQILEIICMRQRLRLYKHECLRTHAYADAELLSENDACMHVWVCMHMCIATSTREQAY